MIEILETIIEFMIWILEFTTPIVIEIYLWSVDICIALLEWVLSIL